MGLISGTLLETVMVSLTENYPRYVIEDIQEKPVTAPKKVKSYYFGDERHMSKRACFNFWQRGLRGKARSWISLPYQRGKIWAPHFNLIHNQKCPLQAGDRLLGDG